MDIVGKIGADGLHRSLITNSSEEIGLIGDCGKRVKRLRSPRPAYLGKRHAKTVGLIVACVAVMFIVSAIALVPTRKDGASSPALPERTLGKQMPPPPYTVFGWVYLPDGITPVIGLVVLVDESRLGYVNETVTDEYGAYQFNINWNESNPYLPGDKVYVNTTYGTMSGTNWSIADDGTGELGPWLWIDVTLVDTGIPEFPGFIVPVVGMMALVVAVSLRRRTR